MISFPLSSLTLQITEGDLTAETTDAVVNAANNHFWMGSGVAAAIKSRGGEEIERQAMAQGPLEPGEGVSATGQRAYRTWAEVACDVLGAPVEGPPDRPVSA